MIKLNQVQKLTLPKYKTVEFVKKVCIKNILKGAVTVIMIIVVNKYYIKSYKKYKFLGNCWDTWLAE